MAMIYDLARRRFSVMAMCYNCDAEGSFVVTIFLDNDDAPWHLLRWRCVRSGVGIDTMITGTMKGYTTDPRWRCPFRTSVHCFKLRDGDGAICRAMTIFKIISNICKALDFPWDACACKYEYWRIQHVSMCVCESVCTQVYHASHIGVPLERLASKPGLNATKLGHWVSSKPAMSWHVDVLNLDSDRPQQTSHQSPFLCLWWPCRLQPCGQPSLLMALCLTWDVVWRPQAKTWAGILNGTRHNAVSCNGKNIFNMQSPLILTRWLGDSDRRGKNLPRPSRPHPQCSPTPHVL